MSDPSSDSGLPFSRALARLERSGALDGAPPLEEQETVVAGRPGGEVDAPPMLGRYPVLEQLGRGGMGQVLEVEDLELGRQVAAKVMLGHGDPLRTSKFVLEAQVSGQLEHPNIVPVYELGLTGEGFPYYTMKRVAGRNLAELLRDPAGPPPLHELLQVFLKVCDALAYAHSRGVLHPDLKPANIMVGRFGEVLLMDWGLAKLRTEAPSDETLSTGSGRIAAQVGTQPGTPLHATLEGSRVGTPTHMSPEQAAGRLDQLDQRSDIFALGIVLYELLTGKLPFYERTAELLCQRIEQGEFTPPARRAPERNIPWELEAVTLKAMALRPADRYQSVEELQADLQRFLAGGMLRAARYSRLQRLRKWLRRHRTVALAAALALLAAGASVVVTRLQQSRAAERRRQSEVAAIVERARGLIEQAPAPEALEADRREHLARPRPPGHAPPPETLAQRRRRTRALEAYLEAAGLLDQALALAPGDEPILELRRRAGRGLGRIALLGGEYGLARSAFDLSRFGEKPAEVERLTRGIEQARDALLAARRERLVEIIDDLRGGLGRRGRSPGAPDLEEYVIEASGYREPQTVALLSRTLAALEPDKLGWSQAQIELASFCCRVLGRLQLARSVPPLATFLARVDEPVLRVEAGLALCYTRRPEAYAPLMAARERLRSSSPVWVRIEARVGLVPEPDSVARSRHEDPMALFTRAHNRHSQGNLTGALADYDAAIARQPRFVEALVNRALVKQALGRRAGALRDLDRALERAPHHEKALYNRGWIRLEAGDARGAAADLDAVIRIAPRYAAAFEMRARTRQALGDLQGARADYDRAVGLAPADPDPLVDRGILRKLTGDTAGAIADYTRAIALDPRHVAAHTSRGLAHLVAGDLLSAARDVARALELDPRLAGNHAAHGLVLAARAEHEGAIRAFTRAIELRPDHAIAHYRRAGSWLALGRQRDALADLDRALALDPALTNVWFGRATLHRKANRPDRAIADFSEVVRRQPANSSAWYNRGLLHYRAGRLDQAIADYTRALEANPRYGVALVNRGIAHKEAGRPDRALADYRAATRVEPRRWQAWSNLGALLAERGERQAGLEALRTALRVAPPAAQARIRRRIEQIEQKSR